MKLWLADDDEMIEWPDAPPRFYLPILPPAPRTAADYAVPLQVHVYERERERLDPLAPVVRYRLIRAEGGAG